MNQNTYTFRRLACLFAAILTLACASHLCAQTLTAVSDNNNIWYIAPYQQDAAPASESNTDTKSAPPAKRPGIAIYHRNLNDPLGSIAYATNLSGQLAPQGIAASPEKLWIAYKLPTGLTFQTITPVVLNNQPFFSYDLVPQPPIFNSAELRALAASRSGAFALLRFETTEQATAAEEAFTSMSNSELGQPTAKQTTTQEDQSDKTNDASKEASGVSEVKTSGVTSGGASGGVDRLFVLQTTNWMHLPLPDNFPHAKPAWLVAENPDDRYPVIITQPDTAENTFRIDRYAPDTQSWTTSTVSVPDLNKQPIASRPTFFAQDNQIILAQQIAGKDELSIHFTILRNNKAIPVGSLSLTIPNTSQWAAIPYNTNLAVLAARPEHKPTKPLSSTSLWAFSPPNTHKISLDLAQLTLQGKPLILANSDSNIQTLTASMPQFSEQLAQNVISLILISLAVLMLLLFLFRDPKTNKLELPPDLILCDFPRRMLAASIDFGIVFFPLMLIFGLSFSELLATWPNNANLTLTKMLPSIILIAVFISHTTITEILTKGLTLGKILTGIRATNMHGNPPTITQSLSRGVFKIIELLIPIALLFPLIIPSRQRIGDIFARTVVIVPKDKDKAHHLEEDEQDTQSPHEHKDNTDHRDPPNDLTKR